MSYPLYDRSGVDDNVTPIMSIQRAPPAREMEADSLVPLLQRSNIADSQPPSLEMPLQPQPPSLDMQLQHLDADDVPSPTLPRSRRAGGPRRGRAHDKALDASLRSALRLQDRAIAKSRAVRTGFRRARQPAAIGVHGEPADSADADALFTRQFVEGMCLRVPSLT